MRFIEELISLFNDTCLSYQTALAEPVDVSSKTWTEQWKKRSQHMARADAVRQRLDPYFEKWRSSKNLYDARIRKEVKQCTDNLVAALGNLHEQNECFLKTMEQEKASIKGKLAHTKKSSRAIASYLSHQ